MLFFSSRGHIHTYILSHTILTGRHVENLVDNPVLQTTSFFNAAGFWMMKLGLWHFYLKLNAMFFNRILNKRPLAKDGDTDVFFIFWFPLFVTHVAPDRVRQDPAQPGEERVGVALPRDFLEIWNRTQDILPKATLEKAHSKEMKANMMKEWSNTLCRMCTVTGMPCFCKCSIFSLEAGLHLTFNILNRTAIISYLCPSFWNTVVNSVSTEIILLNVCFHGSTVLCKYFCGPYSWPCVCSGGYTELHLLSSYHCIFKSVCKALCNSSTLKQQFQNHFDGTVSCLCTV